jgi:hypothetical protein
LNPETELVETVPILNRIWEIFGLNLGLNTDYLRLVLRGFTGPTKKFPEHYL